MKKFKCLLVMMLVLMLTACGGSEPEEEEISEVTSEENTETTGIFGIFTALTLDGEEKSQEIFSEADLTMVNIWATYCGPCIDEMPDLGEISREYEDDGFQIVGIVSDVMEPGDEAAVEIVETTGADYMHLVASDDLINNILRYVSAVPTTIFVDKEGTMVGEIQMGGRSKAQWEVLINNLLEGVQ